MNKPTIPVLTVLAAVGIAASIYLIFFQAPLQFGLNEDGKLNGSSLFFNQKIFYFHTAHAMLMIVAVASAGVTSIVFLVSRIQAPDAGPVTFLASEGDSVADVWTEDEIIVLDESPTPGEIDLVATS